MIADRLRRGDEVRVVSPATSLACIPDDQRKIAEERLAGLGLEVTYSKNGEILDEFDSAPVGARVSDLHEAFSDPNVKGMLTTLGGYNSNQLLRSLDYGMIRDNPKILCGFSDITALATAIHVKTGLVTYSGPHYSTFAMKRGIEYTLAHFERCLMQEGPYDIEPADHWSDDPWYADQENREFVPNSGYEVLNEGEAEGTLLGGHLGTLLLLCGTPYMPDLAGSLLLLECDEETRPEHLDRELQSLAHHPDFEEVRGVVFGKFQKASGVDTKTLVAIVGSKPEFAGIPVIAGASFGHTTPQFTFPIGGRGRVSAVEGTVRLTIDEH